MYGPAPRSQDYVRKRTTKRCKCSQQQVCGHMDQDLGMPNTNGLALLLGGPSGHDVVIVAVGDVSVASAYLVCRTQVQIKIISPKSCAFFPSHHRRSI